MQRTIVIIAHNIRSTHNVGAILRSAEGFGVHHIIFSGYTPYPTLRNDPRLPHESARATKQIHKTALGAETQVDCQHTDSLSETLTHLRNDGFRIVGLEQDENSILLPDYHPPEKIALLLGEEVEGIDQALRKQCDDLIEIAMFGRKESFNVSVATGIALYALTLR